MNNFLQRILSTVIICSLAIPFVLYVENGVVYLFFPFAIAGLFEYTLLCTTYLTEPFFAYVESRNSPTLWDILIRVTFSSFPILIFLKHRFLTPDFVSEAVVFCFHYLLMFPQISDFHVQFEETLIGIIWICPSVIICMQYGLEDPMKLIIICTMTWMADGGGMIFGKIFGNTISQPSFMNFLQKISPNKTIEGIFGGYIFSILSAYGFSFIPLKFEANLFVLCIICATMGQIGDLVESAFKRWKGIKDSRMFWTPLHYFGGIMDRCDSIFFALPATYLYLKGF